MKSIIRKALLLLPAMAFLASCIETYPVVDQMTGIIDETFTRTSFVQEGIKLKTNWEYGDYIVVKSSRTSRDDIDETGNEQLTTDENKFGVFITEYIEENKALFAQMDENTLAAPYIAYYPMEICEQELPNVQKYQADGPYQAPMMAKAPTMYLLFKPICGVMELKLSTTLENAVVKDIVLSANRPLCGSFTIGDDMIAQAFGERRLTLDCGKGVELGSEAKPFWFSVPQGEYSQVKVVLNMTDGRSQTFSLADSETIEVLRAEITTCPINLQSLNGSQVYETATLPTGLEFNRFIKKVANPETDFAQIEPVFADRKIKSIVFVTGSGSNDGLNISTADDAPIYASFDSASGAMTVSTPAKEMRLHRDGTCMFRYLTELTEVNLEALVTDDLCNMTYMFNHCEKLPHVEIGAINPTNIQDMDNCFSDCWVIDGLDFSNFKNDRLENMRSCFLRCYALSGRLDLSAITSTRITKMGYAFNECRMVSTIDIRNIVPDTEASDMKNMFYKDANLTEIFVNDKFFASDKVSATNIFAGSSETISVRTANVPGKLTIHCSQESADWFAITTLRWVNSGYPKLKAIPVTFLDNATGKVLTVQWAAN